VDTATTLAPLQPEHQQAAPRHDGPLDPIDPRIRRTRELLQQSLGHLLETKDFDRISVHEITDAAGVNRATFYAHYNDKFALLECMVATRFHALLDERGIVVQGGCTNALRGLVVGLCDFLASATCAGAEQARPLQPHMETALVAVLRRMLLDGMASQGEPADKVRAAAIAGAIYGATREALNTPNHPPTEQVASTVVALIAPLFAPASHEVPLA
jgi:AcrR family transcriptional regulator